MKQILALLPLILLSCTTTPLVELESDNLMIEHYLEQLFHKKATATVYIVHPEVCGACSNEFLVKMSNNKPNAKFYLLATGRFKAEHQEAASKIKEKIRFVKVNDIARKGLSAVYPQKIILINGKIKAIEIMEL